MFYRNDLEMAVLITKLNAKINVPANSIIRNMETTNVLTSLSIRIVLEVSLLPTLRSTVVQ